MTLQPEVHMVNVENGTEHPPTLVPDIPLSETIIIIAEQLGGDPVTIMRDAVAKLNSSSEWTFDAATFVVAELLWSAYGQVPSSAQLTELEGTIDLMRD